MRAPNYKQYTLDELYDAVNHIDRERFPERLKVIESEILKRKGRSSIVTANAIQSGESIQELGGSAKKSASEPTGCFRSHRITDIEGAEKAILKAWVTGSAMTVYMLVLTVLAMNGVRFVVNEHFNVFTLVHVGFMGGLSYGIYRKSRASAILFVVYLYAIFFYTWYVTGNSRLSLIDAALFYFLFLGIMGTRKYHQLAPSVKETVENREKKCPNCGETNHVANVRCKCGHEFLQRFF